MSVTLTLARATDFDLLDRLVAAHHAEAGIEQPPEARAAALAPLLDGTAHGAVYLIGPPRSPVGYMVIGFGWSVAKGGVEAKIDELFIRPGVRRRGMATEALVSLMQALARHEVRAVRLEVSPQNEAAQRLAERLRFVPDRAIGQSRQL